MSKRLSTRLAFASALMAFLAGCQARTPGKVETGAAYFIKRNLTVRGKGSNPFPPTEENIRAGREHFASYCFVCHGLDGQNTGVPFADRMSPPVPPLNSPRVQSYTDAQLKSVIDNGIFPSGMPAAMGMLSDDEVWQIVTFIRHLPPQGSLGEPAVYGSGPQASSRRTQNDSIVRTSLPAPRPRRQRRR